jgi:hypothetical protein
MARFSSIGDTLWTKRIGSSGDEVANYISQTSDGGYILTGYTTTWSAPNYDAFLMKTDSLGLVTWMKTYSMLSYNYGYSVRQNSDGGYVIAGYASQFMFLIRTNSIGDTLWTKKYWSGVSSNGEARFAVQTSDGGFIIAGMLAGDASILKVTSNGIPSWAKKFSTSVSVGVRSYFVEQTLDGGYLLSSAEYPGAFQSQLYVHKFSSNGNYVFGKRFLRSCSRDDRQLFTCVCFSI